jgi:hypothetical protein
MLGNSTFRRRHDDETQRSDRGENRVALSDGSYSARSLDGRNWGAQDLGRGAGQAGRSRAYPRAMARMVSDLAKPDAVFVIDTGLNTLWSGNWIRRAPLQLLALAGWFAFQ